MFVSIKKHWHKLLCGVAAMMMCFSATCSFLACSSGEDSPYNPVYAESRTVMVYIVAENSLSGTAAIDVAEMLIGISDKGLYPNDRLVIFVDDVKEPRIYMIDRTTTATGMAQLTPVKTYEMEVNSASADVLGEFVAYVKQYYPADSYGLVLSSHGTGWIPSNYEGDAPKAASRRSYGVDNGKNTLTNWGHEMNIADMAKALEAEGGVDFILFDACLMQNVEVAYELRHATKHLIGSPAEIPESGANYSTMVPAMFMKENCANKILQAYYQEYYNKSNWGIVVSDISTEGLDEFAGLLKPLVEKYRSELLETDYTNVQNYLMYPSWFTDKPDFFDMQGVMRNVLDEDEYAEWLKSVAQVVTCMNSGYWYASKVKRTLPIDAEQCCGVTMFVPLSKYDGNKYKFNDAYLNTAWARDVWSED